MDLAHAGHAAVLRVGERTLRWGTDYLVIPKLGFALALGGQPFGGGFRGEAVPTVYGGRIGDSTIAPDLVRDKVVVFAAPTFAFWQRDNLRRYAGARAIVVATLDLGAPPAYRVRRETYWDSSAASGVVPLTIISVTQAAAAAMFSSPFDQLALGATGAAAQRERRVHRRTDRGAGVQRRRHHPRQRPEASRAHTSPIGAHHDHIGMGPPVDHDSIRAFNQVVRVARRRRSAAASGDRRAVGADPRDARQPAPRARRVRLDSIFNGADDDGSGTRARARDRRGVREGASEAEAVAAVRLAHGRGEGLVRRAVLRRSPDSAARLDRRADQHGSDGSRRAGGQSAGRA